jgi:hypothetical protein
MFRVLASSTLLAMVPSLQVRAAGVRFMCSGVDSAKVASRTVVVYQR